MTAAQLQQLAAQQSMTNAQLQQLMRSGLLGNQQQQQQAAQARPQQQQQRQSSASSSNGSNKPFPTKLTQIKEFPIERSNQPPYKLQKALIDNKIVPCINVRPFVFHDLMMTLPGEISLLRKYENLMKFFLFSDFVKHFFPDLPLEKAREMLQEILKVTLYKGNRYLNVKCLSFHLMLRSGIIFLIFNFVFSCEGAAQHVHLSLCLSVCPSVR